MAVSSAVISSRSNSRVKQLRAAFAGNSRLSEGLIAIEGEHLLEEALRSGITPDKIFLSAARTHPLGLPHTTEVIRLSDDVFASATETRSPQGIAALIAPPVRTLDEVFQVANPLVLIAAGLQDPGNLGTLIRSAEAFGASGVLTTPGTVSEWNQKALRASTGSIFRIPVVNIKDEELAHLNRHGLRLFAAVGQQTDSVIAAQDADLGSSCAIMIGNEGAGLSDALLGIASACITIPCPGPVESLNAAIAGSLLLYEASRQRALSSQARQATGAAR